MNKEEKLFIFVDLWDQELFVCCITCYYSITQYLQFFTLTLTLDLNWYRDALQSAASSFFKHLNFNRFNLLYIGQKQMILNEPEAGSKKCWLSVLAEQAMVIVSSFLLFVLFISDHNGNLPQVKLFGVERKEQFIID